MSAMNTNLHRLLSGFLIAAWLAGQVTPATAGGSPGEPVAVVELDGRTSAITRESLVDRLLADGGKEMLEKLIQERVVAQAAKKAGIKVTEADIDAQIEEARKNLPPDQTLETMLRDQGMSMVTFREQIRMRLRLKGLVADELDVSDASLRKYYAAYPWQFEEKEKVLVRHIYSTNEAKLRLVLARLRRGEDFAKLAKEQSEDRATKDKGGVIGWVSRGRTNFDRTFLDAAFKLKSGGISDIVKTPLGYHIIKVDDHKPAHKPTFKEIRQKVRDLVYAQELQKHMGERLAHLLSSAKIERRLVIPKAPTP